MTASKKSFQGNINSSSNEKDIMLAYAPIE